MARFIFGQHIECHLLRIKQVKRIGAPQFTFVVYAPVTTCCFASQRDTAVSVSISVLFYTVGLKIIMSMVTMTPRYLYLIRTADNALYTGITTDVQRRYKQHQSGKGAKALRGKGELTLAFAAQIGDRSLALRIEYRVKQLTKRQKERLVEGEGLEALLSSLQAPDVKND